jgi:hypothetical protein
MSPWIDSNVSKTRCKQRSLQLGLKRKLDGGGVAIELFQVVEFSLRGKKYMDDDITWKSTKER